MRRHVTKVAVLGSGVMGSAIAAHLANAGIRSLVLDIVPREPNEKERRAGLDLRSRAVRDRFSRENVARLLKSKPAALFVPTRQALIEVGNFDDDLPRVAEVDWVIEVVREEMEIKTKLLDAVARHVGGDTIVSSNTSGLSLTRMAEALPEALRPRFLGTHFFNPPRYMKLLELIPTPHTSPEILAAVEELAVVRLGKGVVVARDTPNFIANRIGVHAMLAAVEAMRKHELTIEEVDALTGPALARPKTATFRLADLVGIDVLALVARNVYEAAPEDECRGAFVPPEFMSRMIEKGLLGRKSGGGFYRKTRGVVQTLDLTSLAYRDPLPPDLPELAQAKRAGDPREGLRRLLAGKGRAAQAAWSILAPTLSYAAMRVGEIADDAATVDRAIRLGFNWELGPFEIWDALGFRETAERLRRDDHRLPEWVDDEPTVYVDQDGRSTTPTGTRGQRAPGPLDPRVLRVDAVRATRDKIGGNDSATLLDLGNGALLLEFHSKMNAIDEGTIEMMHAAADAAEAGFRAVVVANDGANFSAGANLMLVAAAAQAGDWKAIERMLVAFQEAGNRLESCPVPVIAAPHGMALGGGCEVVLCADAIRAAAESYIGLVEIGAGLLPAGGGCLRLYRRNLDRDGDDAYSALKKTFETIGMAKVSSSAEEAKELGFLKPQDGWTMNRDYLLQAAKELALAIADSGYVPQVESPIPVLGRDGIALIDTMLVNMVEGRYISEHDRRVGQEIGKVLAGGDSAGPTTVSAEFLLELEREAFLRLCGEPKTHERIEALLKTGKPLRN